MEQAAMQEPKYPPPIEEVVFADDFLRAEENALPAVSPGNRKFLRAFFGVAASRLGWRVREISPQSQGGKIPLVDIMAALGLPRSPHGWAAACTADLGRAADHLHELTLTPASLVIGWGMPPSVLHYIDRQGAAFIDVEIHAIRFTRDLHLAMRTNDAGIRLELEQLRIDEETFWGAAAGLRGQFARRGNAFIARPDLSVGVFVGQMGIDQAVVGDGRLMEPNDFIESLAQWARQVDLLAICPHPAQIDTSPLHPLLDRIPNATLISRHTYSLLCAENLAFVSAISSSVLGEAHYLGCHDIRQLAVDDRNDASRLPAACSPWIPVWSEVASLRSLDAFSKARQGKTVPPSPVTGRPSAFPDDMLNTIFGYRWGFDPAASGLPDLPTLAPGASLSLAVNTPGAASIGFAHGWHWPEPWGVWSAEPRACLAVLLEDIEPGAGYELALYGHPWAPAGATPPAIRLVVNGRECQLRSSQEDGMEWAIQLDTHALERRLLLITAEVRGALRACDVGGAPTDTRVLGLGLRYLTLRKIVPTGPEPEPA
ncbi:hypothetical protein [Burkholderia glumae]|uniref:hypothetical protein n=1 Tax=Burkholderia glumae TaxID=337 RepID=UPI00148EB03C|nr:hypothetical protein [Burkholderia glumae]QJW79737.1 hypothetical protein GAS18_13910 [Burkholderia glumae]